VGRRCRSATIKDVASELHLDWDSVKELDKQYMRAQLARAGTPGPEVIGIDEISIRKRHTYRIVVSDLIRGFHSYWGSEYVNHKIARLLKKCASNLPSRGLTRPTITRWPNARTAPSSASSWATATSHKKDATAINRFYTDALNPYLDFHRPCYFAVDKIDAKGKIRKTYPHDQIMTPWERLQSIPNYQTHLKPGITDLSLEQQANAMSDNDAAKQVQKARKLLFQSVNRRSKSAA